MQALLAACHELAMDYDTLQKLLYVFGHKFRRVIFAVIPHVLYSSSICKILLYNQQLVVITLNLIYCVRAAHRQGKNVLKQVYYREMKQGGTQVDRQIDRQTDRLAKRHRLTDRRTENANHSNTFQPEGGKGKKYSVKSTKPFLFFCL